MHQNLASIFFKRAASLGEAVAVRFKEGRGPYRDMTWSDFSRMIREMAAGLWTLGLKHGSCGAILAPTSHLWVASDLAIMATGGTSVPVYPTSSQADIEFILSNSQSRILFIHSEGLLNKVLALKEKLSTLQKIVLLSPPSGGKSITELAVDPNFVIGLEQLQELGRELLTNKPEQIDEWLEKIDDDDLATIIYTSGTTGTPKGGMLTHANVLSVLQDLTHIIPVNEQDVYLSFLPLSHVFERVCGEFYWFYAGGVCAFAEGIEHVAKNMAETDPTMILVVPRVLDRIYAKVQSGIQGATPRARKLIEWSLAVSQEVREHEWSNRALRPGLKAKYWLAERLVIRKLKSRIGNRLRLLVSGGAPATKEVIQFFNNVGICTLEGYGLTETTAPATVNRQGKIKPGTVGSALPSVEIKIADDGEILVKGTSVFKGYYQAEEATAEAFDDGWFKTGDIGVMDSDGYVQITDRKKDLIINSAGKNIAPQRVEAVLKTAPFVTQAIVFGDKKKHLVALLTLDEPAVTDYARDKGWTFANYQLLCTLPELHQFLRREINERSQLLSEYERIRKFALLSNDLSVESGELTATLKIKRNVIANKYKDLVESLYSEEDISQLVSSVR